MEAAKTTQNTHRAFAISDHKAIANAMLLLRRIVKVCWLKLMWPASPTTAHDAHRGTTLFCHELVNLKDSVPARCILGLRFTFSCVAKKLMQVGIFGSCAANP